NIDLGSEVSTVTKLATLAATDIFWAEILVPTEKLAWFALPEGKKKGAAVALVNRRKEPYVGRIATLAPDLDGDGLMARLLVEIDDPLGLHSGRQPLLLGSFVEARIEGTRLNDVYVLPRSALHEKNIVLLVDEQNRLRLQPVTVAWKGVESVFISAGLQPRAKVVISRVAAPIKGMPLKVVGSEERQGRLPKKSFGKAEEKSKMKKAGAARMENESAK
ncbi:MAG: HlyD family efflux transporter periplasmic adaptor subunit, partial [Deltaproteobacteria bacterium]|nr:HlyD family efflux transporter periplasmic adaptor subunit [Candidatus Tharpella sp.]